MLPSLPYQFLPIQDFLKLFFPRVEQLRNGTQWYQAHLTFGGLLSLAASGCILSSLFHSPGKV